MEFACSLCGYQSERKEHIKTHLNNKTKCEEGIGEIGKIGKILEIPIEIKCEFCQKTFSTKPNLKRHHKTCKVKKTELETELTHVKKNWKKLKNNYLKNLQ